MNANFAIKRLHTWKFCYICQSFVALVRTCFYLMKDRVTLFSSEKILASFAPMMVLLVKSSFTNHRFTGATNNKEIFSIENKNFIFYLQCLHA